MASDRQERAFDADGFAVAGLPHAATGDAAERHDDVVAQVAAEAAARAAADALIPGTITALTGDVTASGTGAVAATLANLPQAVLLARTGALTADLPLNNRKITGQASGGATTTNGANIGDVNTAVAAEAAARAAGDTNAISIAETFATNADAALLASLRTPKPREFWVACVDQDGLTLAGNDTTGAIGIASPGQQTRTVTVTGADTAVASTKTLHFTNGAFTANDQYGELVIGNATNAGSYRIKTVVGGTDVIVEGGPIVNETFSGSVTLTVIGGPKATRDAALTAAKLTPFKTLDRLKEVLPRVGSGANLMVLARARSGGAATPYTLKDLTTPGDMTWSNGLTGWTMIFFRPTDNFVNDLDDKIRSGYQVLAGTASGGYVATAGATVSNIPCQLASGGAASLPAENFAISGIGGVIGYRLRFLSTTPTVALRNWAIMIHRSTSSSVVPAKDLPAVPLPNTDPSGGDKFVIEQSGFWVFDGTLSLGTNGRSTFIGVGSTGTIGVSVEVACPCNSNSAFAGWEVQPNIHMGLGSMPQNSSLFSDIVVDEMGGYLPSQSGLATGLQIGIGYRGRLDNNGQNNVSVLSSCDISDTPRTWAGGHGFQKIGAGCIFKSAVTIIASDMGLNPWGMSSSEALDTITGELGLDVNSIGSDSRPGYRKLRIPTAASTNGVGIVGGAMRVRGIEFDSAAGSLIGIGGVGTKVVVDDISTTAGSGSYPSAVVDTFVYSSTVAPAIGCTVVVGTRVPVTASTSAGDIRLSDGSFVAFSALASQFVEDANGNRFVGTAGLAHAADSVPARSGATAGALADVALTPSTVLARGPSGHIAAIPFSTIAGAGAGITALTGDVAATGPGSAAATIQPLAVDTGKIANAAITNAKRANMAASTLSGNATGSPASPTDLTAAAVKTLLAISFADITGTLQAAQFPALTGDVTTPGGSLVTTLAASGVTAATYGDASHVAQVTVDAKGRVTSASSPSISITAGAVSGLSTTQTGALTGDVTKPAGSGATTLANIPNDTPTAGDLLGTAIAAPAAPAAGKVRLYPDSTSLTWAAKNNAGVVTHMVRTFAPATNQVIFAIDDDGTVHATQVDFTNLSGAIAAHQIQVPANTILGNNTGITADVLALSPAQLRTMLGLDNPQSFEFQVSWGIGDGMNSESVPIRTIVGSWAFWLHPTTRASDVPILGYTSGNHDANLTNPAVAWELPVDATYGHCDLLYQVETWDPQSNSSPTAPNVLLSVSKNKAIDSSPCALTITAAGASATNPQPFSFARGDLIGVRIAPSASFGNSGVAHLKMTVKVRLTP